MFKVLGTKNFIFEESVWAHRKSYVTRNLIKLELS